ncbi:MAG: hypothetical protein ACXAC5_02560 [Promethearchaeota archaeon]|jgi:hypothetical protein
MALLVQTVRVALSTITNDTVDIVAPYIGTPKAALLWSSGATTSDTIQSSDARISFGFTDGSNSFVTCCYDQHGSGTTDSKSRAIGGYGENRVVMHIDALGVIGIATFDAWIEDGVRLRMEEGFSSTFFVTALLLSDTGDGAQISDVHVGIETVPYIFLDEIDVTDPGFQPELIIAAHGPQVANNTNEDNAQLGVTFGKRNGSNLLAQSNSWFTLNNVGNSEVTASHSISDAAPFLDNTTTEVSEPQFLSLDSEGFSLRQIKSSNAIPFDIGYIALGGNFSTNLFVDAYGLATSTGDQSKTGVGFKPGSVLQCLGPRAVSGISTSNPLSIGFGSFDGTDEFCDAFYVQDNVGTTDNRNISATDAVRVLANGVNNKVATFVSFDNDGWTLNYSVTAGSAQVIGIAFESEEASSSSQSSSSSQGISSSSSSKSSSSSASSSSSSQSSSSSASSSSSSSSSSNRPISSSSRSSSSDLAIAPPTQLPRRKENSLVQNEIPLHIAPGDIQLSWNDPSGIVEDFTVQPIRISSPGEITYIGTSLHNATRLVNTDNADYAIQVKILGTQNLRFDLRTRRQDTNNFVALKVDFPAGILSLVQVINGTETILAQATRTYEFSGFHVYTFALWSIERFLYGFINNFNAVKGSTKNLRTEPGFSLNFSTIDAEDWPAVYQVVAQEVVNHADPSLPDDPSDLYLQFRLDIKEEIENPAERTWDTYQRALKLYEQRNIGAPDSVWTALGYPIEKPVPEAWFGGP